MVLIIEAYPLPLENLPCAPELRIMLQHGIYKDCKTCISWQALLLAGSHVMIEKDVEHTLQLSAPWEVSWAGQWDKPWQLTICTASLPSRPGIYFRQNQAAVSAGWLQRDGWVQGLSS